MAAASASSPTPLPEATPEPPKTTPEASKATPEADLKSLLGPCMTKAKKFVQDRLQQHRLNQRFKDPVLERLIRMHPTTKVKEPIICFVKCKRPPYNTEALYTVISRGGFEHTIDVSWIKCVRNAYGKHSKAADKRTMALGALRNEAHRGPAIQAARAKYNVGPCATCSKQCKLAIDHVGKPFARIVDEFLELKGLTLQTIKTAFRYGERQLACKKLAAAWVEYHDAQAELVGLCRSCNSSKGSGGYRHGVLLQ